MSTEGQKAADHMAEVLADMAAKQPGKLIFINMPNGSTMVYVPVEISAMQLIDASFHLAEQRIAKGMEP